MRFEDLIAWQKARILTSQIYQTTRSERFRADFGLVSQIQRAAVSVMANIAEGSERGRRKEIHQSYRSRRARAPKFVRTSMLPRMSG